MTARKAAAVKTADNAFAGAADVLSAGIDALFADTGAQYSLIAIDMIEVLPQIRDAFEDEENTLEDLAASIKARGVLQPILLRQKAGGYELIAGERRYRACMLAGIDKIPACILDMTDEQAQDAQLAENIHRKNLTQIEEAKKIQRDLDRLGSIEAVLEKHQKSRPWLSKTLALLHLPEQARRLVAENVSADLEVINTVKIIEKASPQAARQLVEDLKATRGKENARHKAAAVKDKVKPGKNPKVGNKAESGIAAAPAARGQGGHGPDPFAHGRSDKLAGQDRAKERCPQVLTDAYIKIFEHGSSAQAVLDAMAQEDRQAVDALLNSFYDAGVQAKDVGRAVIEGFRSGRFSSDGQGAFALVAFLHGADSQAQFSLLNIFGSVK